MKEAIGTGATVEEAMRMAAEALAAGAEEEVQYEVLATPKKKTLGLFGGSDAKVRAYVELPDPAPKKFARPNPARPDRPAKAPAEPEARPAKAEKPEKTEKPEKSEKPERPQKPEKTEKPAPKAPRPKPDSPAPETAPEEAGPALPPALPVAEIDPASPAGKAAAYLSSVLAQLGCTEIDMRVAPLENGARIDLNGQGLGVVIGRRGETLDALQYLTSLSANTGSGYFRVTLNIGNYREKREQSLRSLARRTAQQVQRTGRSRTLEPMNPYERRIIHTTVQEIDGVVSASVGEGSGRRVVISPANRPPRGDRPRERYDRGERNDRPAEPARAPKQDATDLPLYGKIR